MATILTETLDFGYTHASCCGYAAVGSKIYMFGGLSSSGSKISIFDTTTRTIETLPSTTISHATSRVACEAIGSKIYIFGGFTSDAETVDTISVFDTETNTISSLSVTLPEGLYHIGSAVVGTNIYLFGGNYGGNAHLVRKSIYKFDTTSNTLYTLSATLPKAVAGLACEAVGSKIYIFGGDVGSSYLDTISVFDAEHETITSLTVSLPAATTGRCAAIGTNIYFFGGNSTVGTIEFNTNDYSMTQVATILCYYFPCAAIDNTIYIIRTDSITLMSVDNAGGAKITYDGEEIASIEGGQTAILSCALKKAKTDIVIAFEGDGTITYYGTETAVSQGQTVTLSCEGKKMSGNVVVVV